jgi:hypothetical protein
MTSPILNESIGLFRDHMSWFRFVKSPENKRVMTIYIVRNVGSGCAPVVQAEAKSDSAYSISQNVLPTENLTRRPIGVKILG